jgi:16S rRNA (cytosine1407-C5)-methyltransferase
MEENLRHQFEQRLATNLGQDIAQRISARLDSSPLPAYWLNPLVEHAFDPPGEELATLPGVWVAPDLDRKALMHHPAVVAGRAYPLNPSSRLPVVALDPQPGEEILDLAAAPGGKTLMMAAAMRNSGRIAAVEPVRPRFHRLRANLSRCGVTICAFYEHDGRAIGRKVPDRFDRVLLDAPCSSEARIRWNDPATFEHWKPRKVSEAAKKQRSLLRSAYQALKPGGVLVYSTCSFSIDENEAVVARLLRREPGAQVISLQDEPWLKGLDWLPGQGLGRDSDVDSMLKGCLRVLPDDVWDGFFLARLTKA